jgi:hypothetical protein
MSKHTPGPWKVEAGHYPSINVVVGPSFKINCVMWASDLTEDDYQKRTADLNLIAAAPDLLEALQMAHKTLHAICERMTVGDRWTNEGQDLLDSLEPVAAAIRKATGETA